MIPQEKQLSELAARYLAGLRAVVAPRASAEDQAAAWEVGEQAAALGLGTLDLAKIHEQALAELMPTSGTASGKLRLTARATVFFNAALGPLESRSLAARRASAGLRQVQRTLEQRTLALADASRDLKAGIAKRKAADASLKASGAESARLLKESRALEAALRAVTQKLYATHETERKKMSLRLHEEIAMTLLGIHVRLLALRKEASASQARLSSEIAMTRRLVNQSVKTINRFTREFGIQDET